jgi:hypothetical protein
MSSITNVNSNSSVVNVGRTTPVSPGAQTADKSIPVVMASDQTAIPVEEQNKVQSEVALSLLGIPRAEVALGIFADVNTYDVNPTEWSMTPEYHVQGDGIKHLPTEAGALVEASRNKVSVLTSKRFFRYQPGRVSAATFGIRSSVSVAEFARNPAIRKYGIYDKYDGYYWETRNNGEGDNFSVVRRTQSVANFPVSPYGVANTTPLRSGDERTGVVPGTVTATQLDDYKAIGLGAGEIEQSEGFYVTDRKLLIENRYKIIDNVLAETERAYHEDASTANASYSIIDGSTVQAVGDGYYTDFATAYNELDGISGFDEAGIESKCKRDLDYWIDFMLMDLEYSDTSGVLDGTTRECTAHTRLNTTNFALSDGAGNWEATPVGKFPKITRFEKPLHDRLKRVFTTGKLYPLNDAISSGEYFSPADPGGSNEIGFTAGGKTKLAALETIVLTAFNTDNFAPQPPTTSAHYGTRFSSTGQLDAFFDVKKHFWAYYVTVTETDNQGVPLSPAQTIVYNVPNFGPSSNDAANTAGGGSDNTDSFTGLNYLATLSDAEVQKFIQNKCQRDIGYVIDGYKNDISGGGNAETTYNCQMFYRGTGLSLYSQQKTDANGDYISEIDRHKLLKSIAINDLKNIGYASNSSVVTKFTELSNKVINNFSIENKESAEIGKRGFAGNLVALRDGLIHTHAAVYDPSLLKDKKLIKVEVTGSGTANEPAIFKLTEGNVTYGQHIKISWSNTGVAATADGLQNGAVVRVARVLDPKATQFVCTVITEGYDQTAGNVVSFSVAEGGSPTDVNYSTGAVSNATPVASTLGTIFVELAVPFMFPNDYDMPLLAAGAYQSEIMTTHGTTNATGTLETDLTNQRVFKSSTMQSAPNFVPKGPVFPYMYSCDDNLLSSTLSDNNSVGFINTALDPNVNSENLNRIRSQIDNVNFHPEYVNWIKNNVKPEYWGVYEYRVPRSRFSHDSLDGRRANSPNNYTYPENTVLETGKGSRNRVYSDLATGVAGTVRPGENFVNSQGDTEKQDSLYDYDFTKVTMLKIEFSWYGAVGALFLAYVPVSNGEARWVRVHHLRASNQLKIASLGNATLPITYTTYGGGSVYCGGDGEDVPASQVDQGYGTISHNIVKYGASYYIDGGDRGTVRLYSYNNDSQIAAIGKQFRISSDSQSYTQGTSGAYQASTAGGAATLGQVPTANITCNAGFDNSGNGTVDTIIDARFFMGATVKTNNDLDQNVEVVWADPDNNRLFLNKNLQGTAVADIRIMPDRAATCYGLETKKVILSTREGNPVRNRVQVYPTKLSTNNASAADDTVRLRFKKTPIFQSLVTTNATGFQLQDEYVIDNTNTELTFTHNDVTNPYIQNGEKVYGWFRGRIDAQGVTAFGELSKEGDKYYFEMLETFEGTVTLTTTEAFLPDLRFLKTGKPVGATDVTKTVSTIEGLSSLNIATDPVVPIPNTGTNVATAYLQSGTEQFDLGAYFDYNKEYLSFPLTDIADSLYFAVDSDTFNYSDADNISLGVTWEEQ